MEGMFIEILKPQDFRRWLSKNHDKERKVGLILHKKHTGRGSPSHRELMEEAICYGWIDTTIKKLDEDRYIRFFARRNKNSKWSYNTLGYAKDLVKSGRMTSHGMMFYEEGLKKLPHDHGIPKDPEIPRELEKELKKSKKLKEFFDSLSPSSRRAYLRWIFRAKQESTKVKRVNILKKNLLNGERGFIIKDK